MKKLKDKPLILITSSIIIQLILYSIVKIFGNNPSILNNNIDEAIPFCVYGIIPYILWYLLLFIIPLMIYHKNKRVFYKYIFGYLLLVLLADLTYAVIPTIFIRDVTVDNSFLSSILNIIYTIDTPPLNCFPSLHCGVSMLFILYSFKLKNLKIQNKILISIISILIMISTVLIKQHSYLDIFSGIIYASISFCIIELLYNKVTFSK